jgi:crotonobetainyl-CoA:carnitine CoA-transferase CaiB-like acyl-CoA transferase
MPEKEAGYMGILTGIHVIDFGQYIAGPLAAGLLADYGANVVRVDPPEGPSFRSPANATWNRGKRSIVLDLKNASENDIARQLIEHADVVVENFRPGVMERLGLGPDVMLAANPRLVYCSLPGFAADDPRAGIAAWEGVVAAATNTYRVPPDGSAPPTFTSLTIASNFAAFLAATAIVAALIARERDGLGQHIEVPLFNAMFTAMGTFTRLSPTQIPLDAPPRAFDPYGGGLYRCADGQWVLFSTFRYRFLEWFVREAGLDALREEGLLDPHWSLATSDRLRARLTEIFATRSAREWEEIGNRAGVPMSRVRTPREWLETEHARLSGIIAQIDDPEFGPMRVPGAPVRLVRTPAVLKSRRTLDADRDTVLAELKGSQQDEGIPAGNAQLGAALEGMHVLDLTHMWAGPAAARLLAEFGAEVIKITDPDDAHFTERFHMDVNRGKRTVLLNLQTSEGLEVFSRLVKNADVVTHNFAYGAADRLGIGYEALRHLRPDIVYASISSCGSAGPWRGRRSTCISMMEFKAMSNVEDMRWGGVHCSGFIKQAMDGSFWEPLSATCRVSKRFPNWQASVGSARKDWNRSWNDAWSEIPHERG